MAKKKAAAEKPAPVNRVFRVVTTADRPGFDAEGNPVTHPPGTVMNRIMWNGVSEYDPGEGYELVPE